MSFESFTDAVKGAEIALLCIHRAAESGNPAAAVLEALEALDAAGAEARPAFSREIGKAIALRVPRSGE